MGMHAAAPRSFVGCVGLAYVRGHCAAVSYFELELELIQPQMAQKPVLRGEVGARAWPGDPGRVVMTAAVVSVASTGHNCQLRFQFSTPRVMGVRGKR